MNSNGKADLYFHAYFWQSYLQHVGQIAKVDLLNPEKGSWVKRLLGLSATLAKVIQNIKKFPFSEENYKKIVREFGLRQS